MSESSYEDEKRERAEARDRSLKARYHILRVSENKYTIITTYSWCATKGKEYINFRFVPGLVRVDWDKARNAVHSLNQDETKEVDYV